MRTRTRHRLATRLLACTLAALVAPLALGAQELSFELKSGANRASHHDFCCGDPNPFGTRLGLLAGAAASVHVWGPVSLQTEALYSQKGVSGPGVFEMNMDYLETPILLRIADRSERAVRPVALVGVAPAFEMSCSGRTQPFYLADGPPPPEPLDCNERRSRQTDLGLVAALGTEVRISQRTAWTAELRYTHGVNDLVPQSTFVRTTNRSLTVLFGLRAMR